MLKLSFFLFLVYAFGAVKPFSLPWMNSQLSGSLYYSADHPKAVFVIEAYYLNCPYCNENAPNVNKLAENYKDEPLVQVLDIGIDRNDSYYNEWIRRHNPNHTVLKDDKMQVISQLGTTHYPSTYVLDCKGNILFSTSGVWSNSIKAKLINTIDTQLLEDCNSIIPVSL